MSEHYDIRIRFKSSRRRGRKKSKDPYDVNLVIGTNSFYVVNDFSDEELERFNLLLEHKMQKKNGQIFINNKEISKDECDKIISYIPHYKKISTKISGLNYVIKEAKDFGIKSYKQKYDVKEMMKRLNKLSITDLYSELDSNRLSRYLNHNVTREKIELYKGKLENLQKELENDDYDQSIEKDIKKTKELIRHLETKYEKEKRFYQRQIEKIKSARTLNYRRHKMKGIIEKLEYKAYQNDPKISLFARAQELLIFFGFNKLTMDMKAYTYSAEDKKALLIVAEVLKNKRAIILGDFFLDYDISEKTQMKEFVERLALLNKTFVFITDHYNILLRSDLSNAFLVVNSKTIDPQKIPTEIEPKKKMPDNSLYTERKKAETQLINLKNKRNDIDKKISTLEYTIQIYNDIEKKGKEGK